MVTRRERIETLLYHYVDVEVGLQDRNFRGDDFLPRMSRAWNHPSYRELRRIVHLLQDSEPALYWALSETYFRYQEVRVARCPKCKRVYRPELAWDEEKDDGGFCKHGGSSIKLFPDIERRVSKAVRPEELSAALDWLEEAFVGDVFIPDDLLALVA